MNRYYPSPSKVVISERIDKIGFSRLSAEIKPFENVFEQVGSQNLSKN
jgi:hypothetical protein